MNYKVKITKDLRLKLNELEDFKLYIYHYKDKYYKISKLEDEIYILSKENFDSLFIKPYENMYIYDFARAISIDFL